MSNGTANFQKTEHDLCNLSQDLQDMCHAALKVRSKAYAPYSLFHVGAAVLTKDGKIYDGCNVENAALNSGICAEKTAIAKAVSEGSQEFRAIAISGDMTSSAYVFPCGACRQFMCEFDPALDIYLVRGSDGGQRVQKNRLDDLFPEAFSPKTHDFAFFKGSK